METDDELIDSKVSEFFKNPSKFYKKFVELMQTQNPSLKFLVFKHIKNEEDFIDFVKMIFQDEKLSLKFHSLILEILEEVENGNNT